MTKSVQTIFVVDDDVSFLRSLQRLLGSIGYPVECFSSAQDFLECCTSSARGCLITDLRMPGIDGLTLQAVLARSANPLPVIFLTGQGDISSSVLAMRQGAEDFLVKTAPKENLIAAVERALARDVRDSEFRARGKELQSRLENLTNRELQVLSWVIRGHMNKNIAAEMGIDERSVKRHRTNLMRKLEVRSVAELVQFAIASGFSDSPTATSS